MKLLNVLRLSLYAIIVLRRLLVYALLLLPLVSHAQSPDTGIGRGDDPSPDSGNLLGDLGGLRPWLQDRGVTFNATQTSDYIGNTQGGFKQGFIYDGLFQLDTDYDLNKMLGLKGASAHITGYVIQGLDLSPNNVGNIMTITNVESQPSVPKLGEVWVQQKFFDDRFALRAGQLQADKSFMISDTASVFVNSTFGFPDNWELNLPDGGPAYPNAVPGVLAVFNPAPAWTLQAAAFNGSPSGNTAQTPDGNSTGNKYGTQFPLGNQVLTWIEAGYAFNPDDDSNDLPATWKLGAWYNSTKFNSLTTTTSGAPMGTDDSSGQPLTGNYSIYGVADLGIFRESGSPDQGLDGFLRVSVNPQSDRNPITWYFDTGLAYTGLFPGRPKDILGLGFAWADMSPAVSQQTRTSNAATGSITPLPTAESLVELTYQAPVSPWLTMQPVVQYIMNPGGKAPMPNNPNAAIPNALVVGLRASVRF